MLHFCKDKQSMFDFKNNQYIILQIIILVISLKKIHLYESYLYNQRITQIGQEVERNWANMHPKASPQDAGRLCLSDISANSNLGCEGNFGIFLVCWKLNLPCSSFASTYALIFHLMRWTITCLFTKPLLSPAWCMDTWAGLLWMLSLLWIE